jgi:hypothetical protein
MGLRAKVLDGAGRQELADVAAVASELLGAIENLSPEAHSALGVGQPVTVTRPDDLELTGPVAAELAPLTIGRPRKRKDQDVKAMTMALATTPRLDALRSLDDKHKQVTALRDQMLMAATRIGQGKTGKDAGNVRAFVRRVSQIIEAHTGEPLSRGKRQLDFAEKLGRLAEPHIDSGSIVEAIRNLQRGETSLQTSS